MPEYKMHSFSYQYTMNQFIETIQSTEYTIRNRSFHNLCSGKSLEELFKNFDELESFRKQTNNLYFRVRACLFLYAGYRFFLQDHKSLPKTGKIPTSAYENLLNRNFEKSISQLIDECKLKGANANLISALAECYHHISFQILADQVRRSVRLSRGNQWMFRVGDAESHPLHIHPKMLERNEGMLFPLLCETTPVRMDLTHSAWSDIFFLGMDYPEGARVINVSVDLGVYGRDENIQPPLESYVRIIAEPVIRLTSLDLKDSKDITDLADLFNFGNDYLSLLKAAVIASGFIPSSFEGSHEKLSDILEKIIAPNLGIELVTKVNDIPKGSRLAVSTNLLASMISALMRCTCQTHELTGNLSEQERRIIASRAILGEWLGGSGGGWQDSGGVWPGIKAIEGTIATEHDPEYNISRGCLLPKHRIISGENIHPNINQLISDSLILFHGGMASNVGPILEMVTEKYLLRGESEWNSRLATNEIFDNIIIALKTGNIKQLAELTTQNWDGPIKSIIPWATTYFTEQIIAKARTKFGEKFHGFLMLGGMSGGGMGMFVDPTIHAQAKDEILKILKATKQELENSLPFAMEPVVYNFSINPYGTRASLLLGNNALMPTSYYEFLMPHLVKTPVGTLSELRKYEIELFTANTDKNNAAFPLLRSFVNNFFKVSSSAHSTKKQEQNEISEVIKSNNGFDVIQHEQIRDDLKKGRIGIARNKLPSETIIEDVTNNDVVFYEQLTPSNTSISIQQLAVVTLAAGVGSRWTKGAGVIKAINPFIELSGKHRSFLDIHLAKLRKFSETVPLVISTSYLTHSPIEQYINALKEKQIPVYLSTGKSIGQRFIPMERDLRFLWEEMPQEKLDENKQKMRENSRNALINWAKSIGEAGDYVDNIALQRFSPLGHWYEIPNMLRNGTLVKLLQTKPNLTTILLHNIDTLGAIPDAAILDYHLQSNNFLTFEVVPRRLEDRGGGLAKVNGKVRLLEGLAQPHDDDELNLSYYNTMTTWINIDKLLNLFGLNRNTIQNLSESEISENIRKIARKMPTYVTIKDVKYRWGHGQEDIVPVAQVEKLWGDMSSLPDVKCGYVVVSRQRGQQLKEVAQLDAWAQDGSKNFIKNLCKFL